jgi:hypothetical protein
MLWFPNPSSVVHGSLGAKPPSDAKRGAQTLSQWGSMASGMHARKSGGIVCFDMMHTPFRKWIFPRYFESLRPADVSAIHSVPDGIFLVRLDGAQYR